LRIGIDAKWFFEGPPSGRVVVQNLVEQLISLPPRDELYIFLDRSSRGKVFPFMRPHVHLVYLWNGIGLLANVFVLPVQAWRLHLDVVLLQNFSPVISNFRRHAYVHDILFSEYPQFYTRTERLYLRPIAFLARFAHRLCTVSSTERKRMTDHGYGDNRRIDVVYHGVSPAFMPREDHDAASLQAVADRYALPALFVLYVGRLNVRKNIMNLLRAMPLLSDTSVPVVLVGGYDWKMPHLDALISELGIARRVLLTGPVYGGDLPLIYSLARVQCFPSYAESFGLPALEGMASGVPVVVSNRTCLPEICGDAALYADPDKPEDIAASIDRLLGDTELWTSQRQRGLERARQFDWRTSAENLLQSIHRAAATGR
jgi:glycosyltransferase involved in cell wall biosynthesis